MGKKPEVIRNKTFSEAFEEMVRKRAFSSTMDWVVSVGDSGNYWAVQREERELTPEETLAIILKGLEKALKG